MEKNIFGLVKKFLQVARVHRKMAQVGSKLTRDLTQPEAILANPTRPEPFFCELEQPEKLFLPTRKYLFP